METNSENELVMYCYFVLLSIAWKFTFVATLFTVSQVAVSEKQEPMIRNTSVFLILIKNQQIRK